jgi:UDPglucose--hexose-1-phosphate uridylyltransferase
VSEIRKDPLSHTWVIIATERQKRPSDLLAPPDETYHQKSCPLCQEAQEPPPPGETRPGKVDPKTGKWLTRVLPNKYPALTPNQSIEQDEVSPLGHYLTGVGGHEIILDTLEHEATLATMDKKQLEAVLQTYQDRFFEWKKDPRLAYVLIFRNYRQAAGASLSHPHSQVIATPIIPPRLFEELREAKEYYKIYSHCLLCEIIKEESSSIRMVYENKNILIFTPYASRFPFEVYFIPKKHQASFEEADEATLTDLADAFDLFFSAFSKLLHDPPFNYMLHVSPLRTPGLLYYHWHIELIPRLARPAGFEFGSGIFINPISPENAAQALREAL